MKSAALTACFRIIIAIAVLFALGLPDASISLSHDPFVAGAMEGKRHAELTTQIEEHGHSHADGDGDERRSGHSHGHNPGDHSHETPDIPHNQETVVASIPGKWVPGSAVIHLPARGFRLDRPPRPFIVI